MELPKESLAWCDLVANTKLNADGTWTAAPRVVQRDSTGLVLAETEIPCESEAYETEWGL